MIVCGAIFHFEPANLDLVRSQVVTTTCCLPKVELGRRQRNIIRVCLVRRSAYPIGDLAPLF
jgi:hypothetical protein